MLATVKDVKDAARKVWPTAAELNVYISTPKDGTPKRYHVSAIDEHRALLGRITADDLNDLRNQLEHRHRKAGDLNRVINEEVNPMMNKHNKRDKDRFETHKKAHVKLGGNDEEAISVAAGEGKEMRRREGRSKVDDWEKRP
jgi:hypothetical protein